MEVINFEARNLAKTVGVIFFVAGIGILACVGGTALLIAGGALKATIMTNAIITLGAHTGKGCL